MKATLSTSSIDVVGNFVQILPIIHYLRFLICGGVENAYHSTAKGHVKSHS